MLRGPTAGGRCLVKRLGVGSILWRAVALGALVAGPLAATAAFSPAAGATAASGTAIVHVQFSAPSTTPTVRIPAPPPNASTTFDQATKTGATFALGTGTGPSLSAITLTNQSCTTGASGTAGACTITVAGGFAAGTTYWVVETSTPTYDAPSEPVPVTTDTEPTTKVTVTVVLVPDDCTQQSTGASGTCAYTFTFTGDGKPYIADVALLTYTYNPATQVLSLKGPVHEQPLPPRTAFHLCYAPDLDMTFGIMSTPWDVPCTTFSELTTTFGAHLELPTTLTVTTTSTLAVLHFSDIPSGVYWFLDVTYGDGQPPDPVASSVPTAANLTATVSTNLSRSSISEGTAITDMATVTGTAIGGAPAGTVTFSECGPTSSDEPCTPTSGNTVGTGPVALTAATTADTATATSASFTPTAVGTWCFSAVYTPGSTSPYTTAGDNVSGTAVTTECVTVSAVAFTSGPPPTIPGATLVHTGMPWSGSGPFEASAAALGAGMVLLGLDQRCRYRRRAGARS